MQRTIITADRDSSGHTACRDDSGGGEPVDNNNDTDNNGSDHLLKRATASLLQRHSYENVNVIENENDEDDDEGMYISCISRLQFQPLN